MIIKLAVFAFFLSDFTHAKTPAWVNQPKKNCPTQYMCAVGEAAGRSQAKAQARAAIAKVFQTQVKSKFSEVVFANDNVSEQSMSATTEELTEMTLEGIEILEMHEDKLGFYALAGLNKRKLSNHYQSEIKKIDQKLGVLWSSGKIGDLMNMGELLGRRSLFYDRIAFLTGLKVTLPFSYKEYLRKKKNLFNKVTIKIGKELDMPQSLKETIANELSSMGFRLNTKEKAEGKTTHILKGKLDSKKEYLKVEGFERYRFNLVLKALNNKRKETGFLSFETTSTGRNFDQSLEKALVTISEHISKNIHQLNIE